MTVAALLEVLADNEDTQVSILNSSKELLIKFNAEGYESISSTITAQTVSKVTLIGNKNISIMLAAPDSD
jgi:hypothetical protein